MAASGLQPCPTCRTNSIVMTKRDRITSPRTLFITSERTSQGRRSSLRLGSNFPCAEAEPYLCQPERTQPRLICLGLFQRAFQQGGAAAQVVSRYPPALRKPWVSSG